MRWPKVGRRVEDASVTDTESLLAAFAASQGELDQQHRERLRGATLAAYEAQRAAGYRHITVRHLPRAAALALALAAVLGLAGTVVAAESGPGQPFYGLRLTIESLTLPAGGSARTEALLAQLDRRLDEAKKESANGRANGVSDAVRAYLVTLDQVSAGIGQDVSQVAVEAALQQHVTIIDTLLGSGPSAARPVLRQALQHTQQAFKHIPPAPGASNPPSHPGPPQSPPGRP